MASAPRNSEMKIIYHWLLTWQISFSICYMNVNSLNLTSLSSQSHIPSLTNWRQPMLPIHDFTDIVQYGWNELRCTAFSESKDVASSYRGSVSVYLLNAKVSPTKTDEPIKMPFGLWTLLGLENCVLSWGCGRSLRGKGNFGGCSHKWNALDCISRKCCSHVHVGMDSPTVWMTSAGATTCFTVTIMTY